MAASAAVGSCFSAAPTPCVPPKCLPSDPPLLRLACFRASPGSATIAHCICPYSQPAELLSSVNALFSHKWRVSRVLAAVAQEEAAVVESGEAVEEQQEGGSEGVDVESEAVSTKLYFGNLPYSVDSAQLAGVIQDYGSPEMVEVLYNRDTGRSRGFAFVTMSSVEDCKAVIENLDGSDYGGRTLRVNFSDKPKPKLPLYPETEFKIFVGNLSWSVTAESLTQVFQEYGHVVGARVLYDGETGRSRGYGFVCYETQQEMDAALEYLDGVELQGRPMRVSPAQGKRS